MKSGIIIDINDIRNLDADKNYKNYNFLDIGIKDFTNKVTEKAIDIESFIKENIIDVTSLSNSVFPIKNKEETTEKKFDFFISYSYSDVETVNRLANYLSKLDFKVFVDNQEWQSAYSLLKKFDDKICYTSKNTYSYEKRNITTTNIYLMLSTALAKVINNSEYFIIIKSKNSYNKINNKYYTTSPWLQYEMEIFNLIAPYKSIYTPQIITASMESESMLLTWRGEYDINNSYFSILTLNDLKNLKENKKNLNDFLKLNYKKEILNLEGVEN